MRNAKHLPHYKVSDYQQWEGDWELIGGIPYAMSPSPIKRHQRLESALINQINEEFKNHHSCDRCEEVHKLDWIVSDDTVLRPDIAIICNQQGNFISAAPALIIEILSPSTTFHDRQVKYEIYEEEGVPYYILVNPVNNTATVFILKDGKYSESQINEFVIHEGCTVRLDFEKVFDEVG